MLKITKRSFVFLALALALAGAAPGAGGQDAPPDILVFKGQSLTSGTAVLKVQTYAVEQRTCPYCGMAYQVSVPTPCDDCGVALQAIPAAPLAIEDPHPLVTIRSPRGDYKTCLVQVQQALMAATQGDFTPAAPPQ